MELEVKQHIRGRFRLKSAIEIANKSGQPLTRPGESLALPSMVVGLEEPETDKVSERRRRKENKRK